MERSACGYWFREARLIVWLGLTLFFFDQRAHCQKTRIAQSDFTSWNQSDGPHAVYEGQTQHVNQLWYDAAGWHNQDLTTTVQGLNTSPLTAFASFTSTDGPHTLYLDINRHVNQLWYDAAGWHGQDLTATISGPIATPAAGLTAWIQSDGPHVLYIVSIT